MKVKLKYFSLEIENLLIIILISFFFSDKIKLFLTSYFVCYLFIIFHELSHIMIATLYGKKILKLRLSIAGVCVRFNNFSLGNIKKIVIYMAGPLANICLAILFNNIDFVFDINIFLAILNLLPVYPLDGYNILKCVLNLFNKQIFLKYVEYIVLSLLFILSIFTFFFSYNPSLFVLFIYIILIKYTNRNQVKL